MSGSCPAIAMICALAAAAHAAPPDDDLGARNIAFARGGSLIKSDAKGQNETELATLPPNAIVRALRSDALGKILLADINGTWSWMPLDGSTKTLAPLPCDAGPAQLAEDGLCVLCRAPRGGSIIVNLANGKVTPVAIPATGARLAGSGAERKLVWADKAGVWSASPANPKSAKVVAKEAPLRSLLPSPDGARALGVYPAEVHESARGTPKPGEALMVFSLDGLAARRKAIQNGVPVEWSHDSKWALLQDRSSACIMLADGGEYKCWRGYIAQSIAPDGKYALLLGNRKTESKADKKSSSKKKKKQVPKVDEEEPNPEAEGDEHGDAPMPVDDVPVPPPSGPQSLYRAQLEGAHAKSPTLVARDVAAAVWIP